MRGFGWRETGSKEGGKEGRKDGGDRKIQMRNGDDEGGKNGKDGGMTERKID